MADGARLAGAFAVSAAITALAVPIAWRIAWRTGFLDRPERYKRHARPTPYLGGAAVMAGFVIAAITFGNALSIAPAVLVCALVLLVVGTVDDWMGLGVRLRLTIQAAAAVVLWASGEGWHLFDAGAVNLALTVFWVIGVVNAFNLFDNEDGAAGTVAGTCAIGIAVVAAVQGDVLPAAMALGLAGACGGFLPYNLSNPAKLFLGDGGSMPIGLVVAGMVMSLPTHTGLAGLLALAPLAGLPILDTTLVVLSRIRRSTPVLVGARDHLAHRLLSYLGSARRVATSLAVCQLLLGALALGLDQAGPRVLIPASVAYLVMGAAVILALENRWSPQTDVPGSRNPASPGPSPAAPSRSTVGSLRSSILREIHRRRP